MKGWKESTLHFWTVNSSSSSTVVVVAVVVVVVVVEWMGVHHACTSRGRVPQIGLVDPCHGEHMKST